METFLTVFPLLAKVSFYFLDVFFAKNAQDQQSRDLLIKLGQELRKMGIKSAKSRFESESQIGAGGSEWDKREEPQEKKP